MEQGTRDEPDLASGWLTVSTIVGLLAPTSAGAQGVGSYRCADGTRFIFALYPQDPRAFVQIDGGQVILARGLAVSGQRHSGAGVTLIVTKDGRTTIRQARRPITVCENG